MCPKCVSKHFPYTHYGRQIICNHASLSHCSFTLNKTKHEKKKCSVKRSARDCVCKENEKSSTNFVRCVSFSMHIARRITFITSSKCFYILLNQMEPNKRAYALQYSSILAPLTTRLLVISLLLLSALFLFTALKLI